MKYVILIFYLLCTTSCIPKIQKVEVELDGYYSWSSPFGGDSIEIKGNTFEFDSWSDEVICPPDGKHKYPFTGNIEIKNEKIYLKHPHLDPTHHTYIVGIDNGFQYLIREKNYSDFVKKGIKNDGPYRPVFTKHIKPTSTGNYFRSICSSINEK